MMILMKPLLFILFILLVIVKPKTAIDAPLDNSGKEGNGSGQTISLHLKDDDARKHEESYIICKVLIEFYTSFNGVEFEMHSIAFSGDTDKIEIVLNFPRFKPKKFLIVECKEVMDESERSIERDEYQYNTSIIEGEEDPFAAFQVSLTFYFHRIETCSHRVNSLFKKMTIPFNLINLVWVVFTSVVLFAIILYYYSSKWGIKANIVWVVFTNVMLLGCYSNFENVFGV